MQKVQSIHFVGIKGVGMTPLAIIAKEAGLHVTGSDIAETFITDTALKEQNIKVFTGFSPEHIEVVDLVIVTGAHGGLDNIEAKTAKEKNIPVLTQAEAVGEFMKGEILGCQFSGISVAGSHGKTTTSAMIASILQSAEHDPSYLIGTSYIPSLGYSGHFGKGNYFVAESDEYVAELNQDRVPKFMYQHPQFAVITNIEHDHPDVYPDLASVFNAFEQFVTQLNRGTTVVVNGDDSQIQKLTRKSGVNFVSFGFGQGNDFIVSNIQMSGDKTTYSLRKQTEELGEFTISIPGEHNVLNATAAIIICLQLGLSNKDIQTYLQKFSGTKRRLEYIGESSQGIELYDDYGHHPTEIVASLATLRKIFPKHFIICVFQPHTYSRTQALFGDFVRAFKDADFTIIAPTYASFREKELVASDSAAELTKAIIAKGFKAQFLPTMADVVKYIGQQQFPTPALLVTMGAGDIYKILPEL